MKPRLLELDIMKGIAIILVIMGHVVIFSLQIDRTALVGIISIVHLPVFFAVSGFLSYKATDSLNLKDELLRLLKRTCILLVPYFVWSALYNVATDSISLSMSMFCAGRYWFLLALWWLSIIGAIHTYIHTRLSKKCNFGIIADFVMLGVIYALIVVGRLKNVELGGWLPIYNLQYFFPMFALGMLMRKYQKIYNLALNKYTYALGLLAVVAGWYFSFLQSYALFAVAAMGAIIVVWMACKNMNPDTKVAKVLGYVGKNTLPIYAIHYFFIAPLPLVIRNMADIPMGFFFQLVIAFAYAIVVVPICLLIYRIISSNPITRFVFFGEIQKQ